MKIINKKRIFHVGLVNRWHKFSFNEQMANIGAEVGRAINWRNKKNINSLKEILRMRELLVDYIMGDNIYCSTDTNWEKYFYPFNFAARNSVI
ncbi:MAG: hypothetical protein AAB437_04350 [Patescibacteria group bacterium]